MGERSLFFSWSRCSTDYRSGSDRGVTQAAKAYPRFSVRFRKSGPPPPRLFPAAQLVSCDLYEHHVNFCVNNFGSEGIVSQEDFDTINFVPKYDLIYCGSLLTHLPDDLFKSAFRLISRSLTDAGVAVITTHGRHSEYIQFHKWKYIEDRLFAIAKSTVFATGFGYADYDEQAKSAFGKQARYGISLSRPHWTLKLVEEDYAVRVLGYAERALDDHQDVLIVGKPGIND